MITHRKLKMTEIKKPPFPSDGDSKWNRNFVDSKVHFVEMPFIELVRYYKSVTKDAGAEATRLGFSGPSLGELECLVIGWQKRDGFYGGTTKDMEHFMDDGYRVGQLDGSFLPGVLKTKDGDAVRGQWLWQEHGDEIDVGMALSGDPDCFRAFENAPTLGGMNIVALFAFSSGTDFDVVARYGAWIAQLLGTCQAAGISPSLMIDQYSSHLSRHSELSLTRVRVKQENDALDWRRYSCLFSPPGFRHLMFGAMTRAAGPNDLLPGHLQGSLGRPVSPTGKWDLAWDEPTRTLTVWGPLSPTEFPTTMMTEKLIETGALTPKEALV